MKKDLSPFNKEGFTLLEPLLAGALVAMVALIMTTGLVTGRQSIAAVADRMYALFLAQEGIEVLRNMRDDSFAVLEPGTWGLGVESGTWVLLPTPDVIEGRFTRTLTVDAPDSERRDVSVQVVWETEAGDRDIVLQSRLTSWR